MEWIGCIRCEKFRRDFVLRTFALMHQFGKFCIGFRAVTKRTETPENMSFGSNGVDWVRSLRKILTRLCLANLCDNGTSSASFASTFVQYRNGSKRTKT
jgi:hypothetical protein